MNTMISVSSTSISGVTLICGPDAPPHAIENDMESCSSQARACLQHQTPFRSTEFPVDAGIDCHPLIPCHSEERSDEESAFLPTPAQTQIPCTGRNDKFERKSAMTKF